jgi:sorbitol-specific phosphotransferase system component IIA
MMRICPETNHPTQCAESCRICAREIYKELLEKAGSAELVTAKAIIDVFGENAFNMLREYGFIEHCRVDETGRHWYAI